MPLDSATHVIDGASWKRAARGAWADSKFSAGDRIRIYANNKNALQSIGSALTVHGVPCAAISLYKVPPGIDQADNAIVLYWTRHLANHTLRLVTNDKKLRRRVRALSTPLKPRRRAPSPRQTRGRGKGSQGRGKPEGTQDATPRRKKAKAGEGGRRRRRAGKTCLIVI